MYSLKEKTKKRQQKKEKRTYEKNIKQGWSQDGPEDSLANASDPQTPGVEVHDSLEG